VIPLQLNQKTKLQIMKLFRNIVPLFMAATVIAAPFAGFAEDKMMGGALMEPVKSVYDSYLKIQTELVKDSLKGVSENATAITKAVRGDDMKMLPADGA